MVLLLFNAHCVLDVCVYTKHGFDKNIQSVRTKEAQKWTTFYTELCGMVIMHNTHFHKPTPFSNVISLFSLVVENLIRFLVFVIFCALSAHSYLFWSVVFLFHYKSNRIDLSIFFYSNDEYKLNAKNLHKRKSNVIKWCSENSFVLSLFAASKI